MEYNINTFVDKIFYINMDKDIERNNNLLNEFKKNNITNFERISGIIFDIIPKNKLMGPFNKTTDKDKYIKGSMGCLYTHRKILQIAKERQYKKILILEDDIYFCENFEEQFNYYVKNFIEKKIYWDILYLGLSNAKYRNKNIKVDENIIKIRSGGIGTHSYIINSNIYDYVLQNIDYLLIEIDLVYNTLNSLSAIHSYKFTDNLVKVNPKYISNISYSTNT